MESRLHVLDVLRGFALLGILLVNIEFFSRPIQAIALGFDHSLQGVDYALALAIHLLLQGKFYPLFSMLFGMGFALMLARSAERGERFFLRYARRIAVLLGIGLVHALFVWSGDILVTYALLGAVLLLCFRGTPARRLPIWAGIFLAVPVVLLWLFAAMLASPAAPEEMLAGFRENETIFLTGIAQADAVLASGSFAEVNQVRREDLAFMLSSVAFFGIGILGYFLIGAWFVRSGRILDCGAHLAWFGRMAPLGIALGLPLCLAGFWLMQGQSPMFPTPAMAAATALTALGNLLLTLGYLSVVVLLVQAPRTKGMLLRLAPAGRMALSNYLAQSLLWTWAFYGYGLGLYGQVPRWAMVLGALAFFGLQLLASGWWLSRFRMGPVEWLWRALTYLRLPPMRRTD